MHRADRLADGQGVTRACYAARKGFAVKDKKQVADEYAGRKGDWRGR